ncbi:MAG: hypothetical protein K0R55_2438, partial [Sporomusa sp.]|nr:hypothetical protein [Sporomusa sp.]
VLVAFLQCSVRGRGYCNERIFRQAVKVDILEVSVNNYSFVTASSKKILQFIEILQDFFTFLGMS